MSARAAARLVSLGFPNVYRYQAGRADWFAAGFPREGTEAGMPRVADVAQRAVPTCRLDERVGDVRDRRPGAGSAPFVVVDGDRVVLGLVDAEALTGDPTTPVERGMQPDPVSFRPDVRRGATRWPRYSSVRRPGAVNCSCSSASGPLSRRTSGYVVTPGTMRASVSREKTTPVCRAASPGPS